ncbi:MAG: MucB/RseB C-terminal domain-containing protein [Thiohalobacterales bacterium]|nr:MucB/RseB C-terminal domain-containing protein [Thiohalobacterales bacterium]
MKLLLAALLLSGAPALAGDSARQWLDGMSGALKNLDYDGTFVYQHDNKLEVMRIIHRADDGGQRERLVSLTGSAREVLRDDRSVTCIMPDNKSVMFGQSRSARPFPVVPEDLTAISRYYRLEDKGEDQLIGYRARMIAVTPRDEFRYGYRFWIERDSRMLLKSELTAANGDVIEQLMFTKLDIGIDIPASDLRPSLTGDGYTWHRQTEIHPAQATSPVAPQWTVARLPAGFKLTDVRHRRLHEEGGEAEHLVYSDGMATVSVYVEQVLQDTEPFAGPSSMGAVNAYGHVVDGFQVTVVGEVPPATVKMLATSVERQAGSDD